MTSWATGMGTKTSSTAMNRWFIVFAAFAAVVPASSVRAQSPQERPHNVVLFVADGLRSCMVDDSTAPTMAAMTRDGVYLHNGHALFPTFTTANASAMATGHMLGDTGDFSNTIYTGFPVAAVGGSVTPFLENDQVLADVDDHFADDYLDEATILKLARDAGFSTAAVGKIGPTLIFDHTRDGRSQTIIVDDATGSEKGVPLSAEIAERLKTANLPVVAPPRGANGKFGDMNTSGTLTPNIVQQDYFAAVTTRAILPLFKERRKPFVLVFWSRDPDGTQHFQGDSLNSLVPGINGPTSLAAIRNADDNLARIRAALAELGLLDTTDIIAIADHGFSTIAKQSQTSSTVKTKFADTPESHLPLGFVALDLAHALDLPLIDPDNHYQPVADGQHSKFGNGLIGGNKDNPKIVITANGGSDLIYLPDADQAIAKRVVEALLAQDYVSGIFVDARLGKFPGALTLDDIALQGSAITPHPAIVISFRSFHTGCDEPVRCTVEIADTILQEGQGMHGSFSRADTWNFMALQGPDFKTHFVDPAPASNGDIGRTIAHVLGLKTTDNGRLVGRVLTEALPDGVVPNASDWVVISEPAANGLSTVLNMQEVGEARYFDAAGFPGRTVGLTAAPLTGSPTGKSGR
jgi:predicted AlkP superfamily pyrophosphatase or phosphodiesterase